MKEESVSPSTIYRWIDLGYAGLSNLDLRKTVKYKPRSKNQEQEATSHGVQYSYEAFWKLTQVERDSAVEMGYCNRPQIWYKIHIDIIFAYL